MAYGNTKMNASRQLMASRLGVELVRNLHTKTYQNSNHSRMLENTFHLIHTTLIFLACYSPISATGVCFGGYDLAWTNQRRVMADNVPRKPSDIENSTREMLEDHSSSTRLIRPQTKRLMQLPVPNDDRMRTVHHLHHLPFTVLLQQLPFPIFITRFLAIDLHSVAELGISGAVGGSASSGDVEVQRSFEASEL